MKRDDQRAQLLDALLSDHAALEAMRSAALGTIRRRRFRRTFRNLLVTAAAAAVLIGTARLWRDPGGKPHPANPAQLTATDTARRIDELTDDELLRQFPPGTCILAEMNGEKSLVFLTAEAEANYLR